MPKRIINPGSDTDWATFDAWTLPLPSTANAPYSPIHGDQDMSNANADIYQNYTWAAKYDRQIRPAVLIELSNRTTALASQNGSGTNNEGYTNGPGFQIDNFGFITLDSYIQDLVDLGFKSVIIKGWGGWHSSAFSIDEENFIIPNGYAGDYRSDWASFLNRWNGTDIEFICWMGDVYYPNFGTLSNPNFRYYNGSTSDKNYIVSSAEYIVSDLGFDGFVLGGLTTMLENMDQSTVSPQSNVSGYPSRQQDITIDLLEALRASGIIKYKTRIYATDMLPHGEHLALAGTIFEMQSQVTSGTDRYDANTLIYPAIENAVNNGCEIIGRIQGSGWTSVDYSSAKSSMDSYGIRNLVDWDVLEDLGLVTGYLYSASTPSRAQMVNILKLPITNPSGCWKDYNEVHKAWQSLNRLTRLPSADKSFVKPNEVPPEPDPNGWPNLDPDCNA